MVSAAEKILSEELRQVIDGLPIGADISDSSRLRMALFGLQFFVPEVLAEIHFEWRFIGLDEVVPVVARKTGEREVEIFGVCCSVLD